MVGGYEMEGIGQELFRKNIYKIKIQYRSHAKSNCGWDGKT